MEASERGSVVADAPVEVPTLVATNGSDDRGGAQGVIVDSGTAAGSKCQLDIKVKDEEGQTSTVRDRQLHHFKSQENGESSETEAITRITSQDFSVDGKPPEGSPATSFHSLEGSVPGSCETESSRSSPSHDGYSLVDGNPIGRPRSCSQDSKRSTKSKSGNGLRRGKWTLEEENYVARVIQDFNSGFLDAPAGTTLRTYLSEKLQCDPMRITKKFTGDACIGKRVFHPAVRSPSNAAAIDRAQAELAQLEIRWRARLEMQQRESAKKAAATAVATGGVRSARENVVTRTASWLERAESVLKHPATSADRSHTVDIQSEIQEVERLIHEGPAIQETSAGLPGILREAQERANSGSPEPEHADKRLRTANQDAEALVGFLRSVRASEASGQEC